MPDVPAAAATITSTNFKDGSNNSNYNEDTILFESIPSQIVDTISSSVQNVLCEEVATLPLLHESKKRKSRDPSSEGDGENENEDGDDAAGGEEKLMNMLRKSYGKNIDIVESYAQRNIFSVRMFGIVKRRTIVQRFINYNGGGDEKDGGDDVIDDPTSAETEAEKENDKNNEEAGLPKKKKYDNPKSKSEIPTSEQIKTIDEEIATLRQRLKSVQHDKSILVPKLKKLNKISHSTKEMKVLYDQSIISPGDNTKDSSDETKSLLKCANAAVKGKEALTTLTVRSAELVDVMDELKAKRTEEDEKDNQLEDVPAKKQKREEQVKRLSLEEDYEERMKNAEEVGGSNDIEGVKRVLGRLSKKRKI